MPFVRIDPVRGRDKAVLGLEVDPDRPTGSVSVGARRARQLGQKVKAGEVAIVGVGPDDSREDRDEAQAEDVGLPEHERDEGRRQPGGIAEDDPVEIADMTDSGVADVGLPAHEDDRGRAGDTRTGEQNP
jgi:hypothetical protein